ncbi:hypothetical protein PSCICJ_04310 [Pseudomonas cichorii]|nr:hypothetical protein PSCICJ_04310 [Pseudomonas cichorii]
MSFTTDAQTSLGHIVAVSDGLAQFLLATQQPGLHFMLNHFQGGMVQRQVMEQQQGDTTLVDDILSKLDTQQRRLRQIESEMPWIEARLQLFGNVALSRVKADLFDAQTCLTADHLDRTVETFPENRCAHDVMAIDNSLQCLDEVIQAPTVRKAEQCLQHIRITLLGSQVVIENPLLQRRQRIDVLNIGNTSRHSGHEVIDGGLVQIRQWQHSGRDALTIGGYGIGRDTDLVIIANRGSQSCQGRLAEQYSHIRAQPHLTHALDQADGEQRMAAQLEKVIETPHSLDLEQLCPERSQGFFDRALRGFIFSTGEGFGTRLGQGTTIQLTVGGQREAFQHDKGRRHHVFGQ